MANTSLSMNKIRQIIRMYTQGTGKLTISMRCGVSRNTVKKYLAAFEQSGFSFKEINTLSDQALEDLFGKSKAEKVSLRMKNLLSFFPYMEKELKRKGVTRTILWREYIEKFPSGYSISQFCFHYHHWHIQVNPVMHLEHKVGDKLYIDFAGEKMRIINPDDGTITPVEVFVAILGASQLTYVEAVVSQQKEELITACINALDYYGGVPRAIVPDNLKAAVQKSNRYEPSLNETFEDFANHYGTTILPARAYHPKDKALVEGAVKIIYTRIYAPLGKEVFHSLTDLNQSIRSALEKHNDQLLKGRNYSRRIQFEEIERTALQPLPLFPYEIKKIHYATVMKNGHVHLGIDKHYYSVPFRLIGLKVKLLYGRSTVEIFYHYERVAIHKRSQSPYNYTTDQEHLASTHRFMSEWSAERFICWAEDIHDDVKAFIIKILDRRQHPEQAFRSCAGVLSLSKKVGHERLINACRRGLGFGSYSYKAIQNILEKNMDHCDDESLARELPMPEHDNIRGEKYYQ